MKSHLSIVVVVIALASFCLAANTASSPAAPAGVVKLNASSVAQVPVIPAQASLAPGEGAPIPWCPPPNGCPDDLRLMAGEGAPIPWCPPPNGCPDDLRLMAGEGAPIPWCPPPNGCPDDLRLMAGEGAPIPWCPPPNGCPDDLRLMAGEGAPIPWCPPTHPDCGDGSVTLSAAAFDGYPPEFIVKPALVGFSGV